ncbi:MAG: (d)CMP kinase [Acidothermaceae bacterium]
MPVLHVDATTLVVAIDGPSGSGKSTVARGVARALGLRYLDTGAMYRAFTWWVLRNDCSPSDADAVVALLPTFNLDISTSPSTQIVRVDGYDVTAAIRSGEVTQAVSAVSALPGVRRYLLQAQHEIIGCGGIAVEGRDIGTTVCPGAPVKVFLTATVDARASRRAIEVEASEAAVRVDLDRRDRIDSARAASPLNQAPDAVAIDSTSLDAAQVIAAVLALVAQRTGIAPASGAGRRLDSIGGKRR